MRIPNSYSAFILNLLSNAWQALEAKRANLPKPIIIEASRQDRAVIVEVADNGPGIPSAVRERLFQPFAGSMRRGGSGLGLAISRELIAAHGGTLTLVRTGAEGTSFRITIPDQN